MNEPNESIERAASAEEDVLTIGEDALAAPPAESGADGAGGGGDDGGDGGDGTDGDGTDGDGGGGPVHVHEHTISIEQEMRSSYVDYAMSVIVGRALPDVRDGLKPVHRRVLYTQHQMKNNWNSAYKKSARIVGDCIGKYHPHGDAAVYDTLVRMAQLFSLRLPLVDGQGNFGSIDGDPPAAMRYTEVRMTRAAHELLADLEKDTVDFQANYDGHDQEPTVLPAKLPNLLINGSGGIAVGMATNIPPHHIGETIDAAVALIEDGDIDIAGLMAHIKGPDFPTGGTIYGREGIFDAYTTGRGKLRVRGKAHMEVGQGGRDIIVLDELPYQTNKARLVEHIAQLVRDKKIEGIADLRDESDRHGIRVVIICKREAVGEIVLNHLYRLTSLQVTFGVINLAIVGGQPQALTLKEMLRHFVDHRREVVTRRCLYELRQAEARAHILAGLLIALDDIDRVIEIIRASPDRPTASVRLQQAFKLTEIQAGAILDMRLARLTGLERDKIRAEFDELQEVIAWLKSVLADDALLMGIIKDELLALKEQYTNERRTTIVDDAGSLRMEDLIADEDMVVTISSQGYVKRTPLSAYRAQRRGGRGKTGMATKDEDYVKEVFVSSAHQPILFFTSKGRAFSLKTYELPKGNAATRGKPIINVLEIEKDEDLKAVLPVKSWDDPDACVMLATRLGRVKKTVLKAYSNIRKTGIIGIRLNDGDDLIDARLVYPYSSVLLASRDGQAIRFASRTRMVWNPQTNVEGADGLYQKKVGVRPMGRVAAGVRGMRLEGDDYVVSMAILTPEEPPAWWTDWRAKADSDDDEKEDDGAPMPMATDDVPDVLMLTITEIGFGKRSPPWIPAPEPGKHDKGYRLTSRGSKGVRNIDSQGKAGKVVGVRTCLDGSEIIVVTDGGKLIRTTTDTIRQADRASKGVRVIRLDKGEKVVSFDVLPEDDSEEDDIIEAAVDGAEEGVAADSATGETASTEPEATVEADAPGGDE